MSLLLKSDLKIIEALKKAIEELQKISNAQSQAILQLIKNAHTHPGASGAITTDVSKIQQNESSGAGDSSNSDASEERNRPDGLHDGEEKSSEEKEESFGQGNNPPKP